MGHAPALQVLHRLLGAHEGHVLGGGRRGEPAGEGGVHPQGEHVVFKVPELGVDEGVAPALGVGDVVQLGEDHVEGLGEGGDPGDLPAVLPPLLLHPEVGVDEDQGLHGQIVQLQVPHGVVARHVADVRHVAAAEPQVRVVVVEVGHPLAGAAAELADVVAGRRRGHQGQVHVHPRPPEIPGHGHRHEVDSGDVLQGAEGGGLQAQTHHLIEVLPPAAAAELPEAVQVGAVGHLVLRRQGQIPQGLRRQEVPLRVQEHLEQGQEEDRPGPVALPPLLRLGIGEHGPPGEVVGEEEPALLRLRGEQKQVLPAERQHVGAAQAAAVIQGGEALDVVLLLQQPGEGLPAPLHPQGGGAGGEAAQESGVHLTDPFSVHGDSSFP